MGGFKKKSKNNSHNLEKEIKGKINLSMILKTKMSLKDKNQEVLLKAKKRIQKRRKGFKSQFKKRFKRKDQSTNLSKLNKRESKNKESKQSQKMIERKIQ